MPQIANLSGLQTLDIVRLKKTLTKNTVFSFTQIDSTNQYLLNHAKQLPNGAVCLAQEQTAGRGRRGRRWHSPLAANIYLSQFFQFQGDIASISGMGIAVGIAIAETLTKLNIADIKLKWPNDLYWQNKKLGGILLESVPLQAGQFGIVVGVGLNVLMQEEDATAQQIDQSWTSLAQIIHRLALPHHFDKTTLIIELVQQIQQACEHYIQQGLTAYIARWQHFDHFLDQPVNLVTENATISAIAKGIDSQGALLVEIDGKLKTFHSAQVSLRQVK